jgi:hypothetical protein
MLGTSNVVDLLRGEGCEVSNAYVAYLLRERIIPTPQKGPGGVLIWLPGNVLALRDELRRRGRTPEDTGRTAGTRVVPTPLRADTH